MKHSLIKNSLTIKGSGGKPSTPPPPVVTQYPGVLAPPSYSDFNSINSFSYAEMIDLLSDGPIEGLINKNGRKVYDENIFEGIYLNDTAVKETSSIETQYVSINFLKNALKTLWAIPTVASSTTAVVNALDFAAKITYYDADGNVTWTNDPVLLSKVQQNSSSSKAKSLILDYKDSSKIPDKNFTSNITLTYYPPEESIAKFVSLMNGDVNSALLINKAFDLSPFINERPFLTVINIPKFNIYLDANKFDSTEGGSTLDSPLTLGINNLSENFYFSISYDSLNSFNYFELPRSFLLNPIITPSNKKTFQKTIIENPLYLQYEVSDVKILIWSVFNLELDRPKNFDIELDKYFNNLIIFQNKKSLYNYNLVESEFRNGSELQVPLRGFSKTEMDIEYNKELIGPFRLTNNFATSSAFEAGGVQRVKSLLLCANNPPFVNLSLQEETSDDVRFAKSWPVEYATDGSPYVVCNFRANYAQFDKTSSSRVSSDASPLTHYVSNQNVEEVYVTLNISQLSDTNHIELVCSVGAVGNKYKQTENPPKGMNTYGNPPGVSSIVTSELKTNYLLTYGDSYSNSFIVAGNNSLNNLFTSVIKSTSPSENINIQAISIWNSLGLTINTNYIINPDYKPTSFGGIMTAADILANRPNSAFSTAAKTPDQILLENHPYIFSNTLLMKSPSSLRDYMVPNEVTYATQTIPIKGYLFDQGAFENKIKIKTDLNDYLYEFAIPDSSKIAKTNYFKQLDINELLANKLITADQKTYFDKLNSVNIYNGVRNGQFYISSFDYYASSASNLTKKHIVAVNINSLIPFKKIFNGWKYITYSYNDNGQTFTELLHNEGVVNQSSIKTLIDLNKYPYIREFIANPFINNSYLYRYPFVSSIYGTQPLSRVLFDPNLLEKNRNTESYISVLGNILLIGLNYNYLLGNSNFWDADYFNVYGEKKLSLDSLEFLLANFGYQTNDLFFNNENTALTKTSKLESSLKKFEAGRLIGGSRIYSYKFFINPKTWVEPRDLSKNNYNIYTTSANQKYDSTRIYIYDMLKDLVNIKTYRNNEEYVSTKTLDSNTFTLNTPFTPTISNTHASFLFHLQQKDVVISYDLISSNQISNTSNLLQSNASYNLIKDGNASSTPSVANMYQSLSAGAKLPAIVSVKVETGYEGRENLQRLNSDEYFAYQFDIFGIASEQALVDLGRVGTDFIYSKRVNGQTGGYFKNIRNEYIFNCPLYLFKVTKRTNGVNSINYFFETEVGPIGGLPVTVVGNPPRRSSSDFINDTAKAITILTRNNVVGAATVGIRQTYTDRGVYDREILPWTDKVRDFTLTGTDITDFMENNLTKISLARAIVFLKKVKKGRSLFPVESYPSDSFALSVPVSNNPDGYDRYELFFDANNSVTVDIFEYRYALYNNIDVKGGIIPATTEPGTIASLNSAIIDKDFISKDLYMIIYEEKILPGLDFLNVLRNKFPQDYYYNMQIDYNVRLIVRFTNNPESISFLNEYNTNLPTELNQTFFIASAFLGY